VNQVGIECLSVFRRDNVASGLCIGIYFNYAINCWTRGVESNTSVGSHIEADQSSHLEITGNYIHHAYFYDGVSTHGYGITLFKHTGDCKVENNILKHLRHSVSMQCGANGNVIAYNYSTDPNRSEAPANLGADISLHGHYSYSNLFEGNIVQNIQIDQTWGPSGPLNTFFRNRAELYGILMSSGTANSDSENFVGNEITNTGPLMGLFLVAGAGHFQYGNNVQGSIIPPGTTTLADSSYYLSSIPTFWSNTSWPSVGEPVLFGGGSNPARDRFFSGGDFTQCDEIIPTGISDAGQPDRSILIYPNPAHAGLHIRIYNDGNPEDFSQLCLTDATGRIILEKKSAVQRNENFYELQLSASLNAGIYFLVVQTKKKSFAKKIVLN